MVQSPRERRDPVRTEAEQRLEQGIELASVAAPLLREAERAVREAGDVQSLARFAYQAHKAGLDSRPWFDEVQQRVAANDPAICIPDDQDAHELEIQRQYSLMDIGAWQSLSGRQDDSQATLHHITDTTIKVDMITRIAYKLMEREQDPTTTLLPAEAIVDTITDQELQQRTASNLIRCLAQHGDRTSVERLVTKYFPDRGDRYSQLIPMALILHDHGVAVGDVFARIAADQDGMAALRPIYREDVIEGLIKTSQEAEAKTILLGRADVQWRSIFEPTVLSAEMTKTIGCAAAECGDETTARHMIHLLTQRLDGSRTRSEQGSFEQTSLYQLRGQIIFAIAMNLAFGQRTAVEKARLMNDRFHQPILAGVKDMIKKEISDVLLKYSGLHRLAEYLSDHGSNPNLFTILDDMEKVVAEHPEIFTPADAADRLVDLAKLTAHAKAKQLSLPAGHRSPADISAQLPLVYIAKAKKVLADAGMKPKPGDGTYENLWANQARIAAKYCQAATGLLADRALNVQALSAPRAVKNLLKALAKPKM